MSDDNYLEHLKARIAEIDHEIAKAVDFLEHGKLKEKVVAAGELTLLQNDRERLTRKLEKAKESHADEWSALQTAFREDLDALADAIETWFVKHREIRDQI